MLGRFRLAAIVTAQDGGKSVMVVGSDGEAHRKTVTLGIDDGIDVQVRQRPCAGGSRHHRGAYGLDEGTRVKIGNLPPVTRTPGRRRKRLCPPNPRTQPEPFWLARSTRTIFFFAILLTLAGIYFAFQVPISVFPDTNFPRVIIGMDNGVMPAEQMEVTITQPIENAVNAVPGLESCAPPQAAARPK